MEEKQQDQNQHDQELDEECRIKAVIVRFAELEGRMLWRENKALSQNSFYQPSETSRKMFLQRIKHYT